MSSTKQVASKLLSDVFTRLISGVGIFEICEGEEATRELLESLRDEMDSFFSYLLD